MTHVPTPWPFSSPRRLLAALGLASLVLAASARGQTAVDGTAAASPGPPAPRTLFFVVNDLAVTADHGAVGSLPESVLGILFDTNVAAFTPGWDTSAVKVHATPEFNVLVGDVDWDGDFWQIHGGDVDALGVRRRGASQPTPVTTRDLVMSTEYAWGQAIYYWILDQTGALDGSLFSLSRSAGGDAVEVEHFLTESLVLQAIGQGQDFTVDNVDVDAFAQDGLGNVFLSFRTDEWVNGVLVEDDGVVCLPRLHLVYDERGNVTWAGPGKAVVVLDRGRVDALVTHAGLRTEAGTALTTLGDLQALEIDPLGGTFIPVQPIPGMGARAPHFLFNGQRIGATVLTTRDGGRIATLNGRLLGNPVPHGGGLGLDPETSSDTTDDLNGLLVGRRQPPAPCMDVDRGEVQLDAGEEVVFFVGNMRPGGWAWMTVGFAFPVAGDQLVATAATPLSQYPWIYPPALGLSVALPLDERGRAVLPVPVPPGTPLPLWVVAQAFEVGTGRLSTPAAAWCPP